jgi:hypothetical protein
MIGNKKNSKNTTKGFTLFYALLVSSLALSIGAAIFDITLREIDLSAAATQSQYAVYVADTGAECALYWDSKYVNVGNNNNGGSGSAFATSSTDTTAAAATSGLLCNGADVTAAAASWTTTSVAGAATTTFTILGATYKAQTPCAVVYVAKVGNPAQTTVTAHGYNTCVSSSLQLERVFQVSY